MTMHYGGTEIGQVFYGPTEIGEAWVWDGGWRQVFSTTPPFARQRMTKSGSQGSNANPVPNWASDPTAPAVITGHRLVVQGSATATITASIGREGNGGGTVTLYHNGGNIGSQSWAIFDAATKTITATRPVSDGDTIHIGCTGVNVAGVITQANTWIEVAPT